jgi:hypothetical protein
MPTDTPTLDEALAVAQRLSAADQLRLAQHLLTHVTDALDEEALPAEAVAHLRPGEDPWDAFFRIGAELSASGPVSPSASEDLMQSRR